MVTKGEDDALGDFNAPLNIADVLKCNRCGERLEGLTNFHARYEDINSRGEPCYAVATLVCCKTCREEIFAVMNENKVKGG